MTFQIGQRVVCVDDSPPTSGRALLVVKGNIYTVSDSLNVGGLVGLLLEEVEPINGIGWHVWRFRPVVCSKTDISIFTKMLDGKRRRVVA
jgi:hypothetical protein